MKLVLTVTQREEAIDAVMEAMPSDMGYSRRLASLAVDAITRQPAPKEPR